MRNELCERLGIEVPIFAFTDCRDVVVAVSQAGGLGVLGTGSEDTVRSRSWAGKLCRMLRNDWTEAWERDDTPDPLSMPLQGMVTFDAVRRTHSYAGVERTQDVAFNPVGQTVGMIRAVQSSRDVIQEMLTELVDAADRLSGVLSDGEEEARG